MSSSSQAGQSGSGSGTLPPEVDRDQSPGLTGQALNIFTATFRAVRNALKFGTDTVDNVAFPRTALTDGRQIGTDAVNTQHANAVRVLVDDGDNQQAVQYDIEFQVWDLSNARWVTHSTVTGTQSRSFSFNEPTTRFRVLLTNTSGAENPFAVYVEAVRE